MVIKRIERDRDCAARYRPDEKILDLRKWNAEPSAKRGPRTKEQSERPKDGLCARCKVKLNSHNLTKHCWTCHMKFVERDTRIIRAKAGADTWHKQESALREAGL